AFVLAEACSVQGSWGPVVECFILVMALCGLRPGEAAGLLWEDIDLPENRVGGWVTVRRPHRPVAARWLDRDEDPEWAPLKDLTDTRRAAVDPVLVAEAAQPSRPVRRRTRRTRLSSQRQGLRSRSLRPQRVTKRQVGSLASPS